MFLKSLVLLAAMVPTVETLQPAKQVDTIAASGVTAARRAVASRADTIKITTNAAQSVTDILLQSSGFVVCDYGGPSGGKGVNLRGLGSGHTGIYIDGIKVKDAQKGQSDLSLINLSDYSAVAVDYAQNSVNFITARPKQSANARFYGGSFNTYNIGAQAGARLGDNLSMRLTADGLSSKGYRENSDIRQIKGGIDIFGQTAGGEWIAKAYINSSERGTPGSVDWPSTDRQQDRNAFVQAQLRQHFGGRYSLNVSAKAAVDMLKYMSEWGDSYYHQKDIQLNTAQRFKAADWLDLSADIDFGFTGLESTGYNAQRWEITAAAGAEAHFDQIRAAAALQYDAVWNVLSPSAQIRLAATDGLDIVAFGRRAYRIPTFNELYYPGFGNSELRPEDAWLTDIGLDWHRSVGDWALKAKVDGFNNHLTDKIVSAPTAADPSIWLPYNVAEVKAGGVDAALGFVRPLSAEWNAHADIRYTFMSAEGVPFMDRHSAAFSGGVAGAGWSSTIAWLLRAGRSGAAGPLPSWNTLDLTISRTLGGIGVPPRRPAVTISLSARNIFNTQYELAEGYPMPGRAMYVSLIIGK